MSKNEIDIKKLLKDEQMVLKLGLMFVILGFVVGYSASFVAEVNEGVGIATMQSAQAILLVGVLLFVYYFVVFFDIKKKDENLCSQCNKSIDEGVAFCPHCGKDSNKDIPKTSNKSETNNKSEPDTESETEDEPSEDEPSEDKPSEDEPIEDKPEDSSD